MLEKRFSPMTRRWPFARHLGSAAFLALAAVSGCGSGDGLDRLAVSGIVMCDGKRISSGAILFEPETYQSGTAVGATIHSGSFSIPKKDGPVPGTYKVRIYASSGTQAPPSRGQTEGTPRPMVDLLPEQYNAKTKLRAW